MADTKFYLDKAGTNDFSKGIAEILRTKFGTKADAANVYSKIDADGRFVLKAAYDEAIGNINTDLEGKVDSESVYTKTQIDTMLQGYLKSSSDEGSSDYATQAWVNTKLDSYVTNSFLSSTLGSYVTQSYLTTTLGDYLLKSDANSLITTIVQNYLGSNYYTKIQIDSFLESTMSVAAGNALSIRIDNLENRVNELSTSGGSGSSQVSASLDLNNIWNWANIPANNFEFHSGENTPDPDPYSEYGRAFTTAQMYQRNDTKFSLGSHTLYLVKGMVVMKDMSTVEFTAQDKRGHDFFETVSTIFTYCNTKVKKFLDVTFNIGETGLTYNGEQVLEVGSWNSLIRNYYITSDVEDKYRNLIISDESYPTGTLTFSICPFKTEEKIVPYEYPDPNELQVTSDESSIDPEDLPDRGQIEIQWRRSTNTGAMYNRMKFVMDKNAPNSWSSDATLNGLLDEFYKAPAYYQVAQEVNLNMDKQHYVSASFVMNGGKYKLSYKDKSNFTNVFEAKSKFIKLFLALTNSETEWNAQALQVYWNDHLKARGSEFSSDSDIMGEINNLLSDIGYVPGATDEALDTSSIEGDYLDYIKFRYGKDVLYTFDKMFQTQSDLFTNTSDEATVTSLGGCTGEIALDSDYEDPGNVRFQIRLNPENNKNTLYGEVVPGQIQEVVKPGMILLWPGSDSNVPTSYLLCNGSAVLKASYEALYNVIGDAFTDRDVTPSTEFNIPNMEEIMRGIHYIIKV